LPHRLCLLRVLLGATATVTSFPLSKHIRGGDTTPTFSGQRVYLQFTWEMGLPPPLWSFPPTTTFTSFPDPGCWGVLPPLPSLAGLFIYSWLVYLQFTWEVGLPPSPVEFSSHCCFYKLSSSWLLGGCHSSCLLWLACLFTVP
jgi:hypothetical protein